MKNGSHSDVTKFSKIIKYIKKEVSGACFERGLPTERRKKKYIE